MNTYYVLWTNDIDSALCTHTLAVSLIFNNWAISQPALCTVNSQTEERTMKKEHSKDYSKVRGKLIIEA